MGTGVIGTGGGVHRAIRLDRPPLQHRRRGHGPDTMGAGANGDTDPSPDGCRPVGEATEEGCVGTDEPQDRAAGGLTR